MIIGIGLFLKIMFNILNLFKKNNQPLGGGWLEDETDKRDYPWELFFGSITPEADKLPETFSWKKQMPSKLPVQGNQPACVSHCFACYQMFNSLKEGNDVELSPRFLYSLTGKPNKGRTFRSNVKVLRDIGNTLENVFPNETELSHEKYCDKSLITSQMNKLAEKYKIKSWTVLNTNLDSLKRAISRKPVAIAIGGNNTNWKSTNKDNIPFGKNDWYHAILAIGWDKDKIEIANWWKHLPYGFLSSSYPIVAAYSLEDLPDFPKGAEGWCAGKFLKRIKSPEGFVSGEIVTPTVYLNLRNKAGLTSKKIKVLKPNQKLKILEDEKQSLHNYQWYPVKEI